LFALCQIKENPPALFLIPTPQVPQKIVTGLYELYEHNIQNLDMQGDLYEYMLGKLATAGQNGQFRTRRHIRDMMLRLLARSLLMIKYATPACSTAGFLSLRQNTMTHP
jgi:type I restriction enzyme M protein